MPLKIIIKIESLQNVIVIKSKYENLLIKQKELDVLYRDFANTIVRKVSQKFSSQDRMKNHQHLL